MNKPIFFVAGKSGGHIIPALTLARQYSGRELAMITTDSDLDRSLIAAAPVKLAHDTLPLGKRQGYLQLMRSCLVALKLLRRYRPERVISMGGLVSVPVCLVARLLGIPYELYELNVKPGKAVHFLASGAEKIYGCFAATKQYLPRAERASYPLRFQSQHKVERAQACHLLGLNPEKKVIMIVGGSQGSHFLNELAQALVGLGDVQILHQTGQQVTAGEQVASCSWVTQAYVQDIHLWYSAADVVITRAGAGALHELMFFGKQGLIIPLESASTDHQVDNAHACAAEDPTRWLVVRQHELKENPELFMHKITQLLKVK